VLAVDDVVECSRLDEHGPVREHLTVSKRSLPVLCQSSH
jgi:hypothetical protein